MEGSKTSFLKKRSKKLLVLGALATPVSNPPANRRFFAAFFAKKEVLASFPAKGIEKMDRFAALAMTRWLWTVESQSYRVLLKTRCVHSRR
jgi:hypothetical protein